MIIMDLRLDNIYAFKNFHANFSYPKKIVNTNVEYEYLSEFPNFRYKKVNIIMGANSSGKTTLGKAIIAIFNFIQRDNPTLMIQASDCLKQDSFIGMDFVEDDIYGVAKLFRLQIKITKDEQTDNPVVETALNQVIIKKTDRYETCVEKIEKQKVRFTKDTVSLFDEINQIGWYFSGVDSNGINVKNQKDNQYFIQVLNLIMQSFDGFITDVKMIEENDLDSLLIKFNNGESVIYHNGEPQKEKREYLSKGTDSALAIAKLVTNIMLHKNGFYYCDEKFCFVQSDLEKSILSIMIELLGKDQQLFFTTHNTDILELDLPKHCFSFLKKNKHDLHSPIELIFASQYLKKETDSLRNAVENDLFNTSPDDSKIYEIPNLLKNVGD